PDLEHSNDLGFVGLVLGIQVQRLCHRLANPCRCLRAFPPPAGTDYGCDLTEVGGCHSREGIWPLPLRDNPDAVAWSVWRSITQIDTHQLEPIRLVGWRLKVVFVLEGFEIEPVIFDSASSPFLLGHPVDGADYPTRVGLC